MSFLQAGNTSDAEQDKVLSEYRLSRSNNNLGPKPTTSKFSDVLWNNKDDSDSEISDSGNFLAKGKRKIVAKKIMFFFLRKKNASTFD